MNFGCFSSLQPKYDFILRTCIVIKLTSFAKFRWVTAVNSSVFLIDHYCCSESGDGEILLFKCPIFVNHIMTVLVT